MIIFKFRTYIPEKRVWVSTVAHNTEIGLDRTSETMVFKGNKKGITNYCDLDFDSHGYIKDPDALITLHNLIVKKWRDKK